MYLAPASRHPHEQDARSRALCQVGPVRSLYQASRSMHGCMHGCRAMTGACSSSTRVLHFRISKLSRLASQIQLLRSGIRDILNCVCVCTHTLEYTLYVQLQCVDLLNLVSADTSMYLPTVEVQVYVSYTAVLQGRGAQRGYLRDADCYNFVNI